MEATVSRESLLRALESTTPGLSSKEITEQSDCFAFRDGTAFTFNDEVSYRCPVPFPKEFTGAVRAEKFLSMLRKLPDEELQADFKKGELALRGKGREVTFLSEAEVLLQADSVEQPGKWYDLPDEFAEAVSVVAACASGDRSRFAATCVHVTSKFLEASDDVQCCRWPAKLSAVTEPMLVRASSLKAAAQSGVKQYGLTDGWLHFRSRGGLTVSCRRFIEEYPDLSDCYKPSKAKKVKLLGSLKDVCDRAGEFSKENETDLVQVEVVPGRITVRSASVSGKFRERKKVQYDGEPLSFLCPPQLLASLFDRNNELLVSLTRLWVKSEKHDWMTCLSQPADE